MKELFNWLSKNNKVESGRSKDFSGNDEASLNKIAQEIDELIEQKTEYQKYIDEGDKSKDLVKLSDKCRQLNREIRAKAGDYIKEKYLKGTQYKNAELEDVLIDLDLTKDKLDEVGIYFDEKNMIRLKKPEEGSIPGSWEDKEVLKALIVGAVRARQGQYSKLEILKDVYRYLALPFSFAEDEDEQSIMEKIRREKRVSLLPITLALILFVKEEASVDKKVVDDYFLEPSTPKTEQLSYPNVYHLTEDDKMGIGDVAVKMLQALGKQPGDYSRDQLYALIKQLAIDNNIDVPEVGAHGSLDDERLPVGFAVKLSADAWRLVEKISGNNINNVKNITL